MSFYKDNGLEGYTEETFPVKMSINICSRCVFFKKPWIDGYGFCEIKKEEARKENQCSLTYKNITKAQVEKILSHFQSWRKGDNNDAINTYLVGIAINKAIHFLKD